MLDNKRIFCKQLTLTASTTLACALTFSAHAQQMFPEAVPQGQVFLLNISLDGRKYPHPFWVKMVHGDYFLTPDALKTLYLPVKGQANGYVDISHIPQVQVQYRPALLELNIKAPPQWQPTQSVKVPDIWGSDFYRANVTPGFLLNYDIYSQHSSDLNYFTALLDGHYFNRWEYFNFSGLGAAYEVDGKYYRSFQRLSTNVVFNDRQHAKQLIIGDMQTDSDYGFNGVYMAGIQYRRDYALRPDLVTYPMLKMLWILSLAVVLLLGLNLQDSMCG